MPCSKQKRAATHNLLRACPAFKCPGHRQKVHRPLRPLQGSFSPPLKNPLRWWQSWRCGVFFVFLVFGVFLSPAGCTESWYAGEGGGVLGGGQHRRVHTLLVLPHLGSVFYTCLFENMFAGWLFLALSKTYNDVCKEECGNAPTCVK